MKFKGILITPDKQFGYCNLSHDGRYYELGKDEVLGFVASMLFTGKPLFGGGDPMPIIEEKRSMREAVLLAEIIRLKRELEKAKAPKYSDQAELYREILKHDVPVSSHKNDNDNPLFNGHSQKITSWKELDGKEVILRCEFNYARSGSSVLAAFEPKTGKLYVLAENIIKKEDNGD